MDHSQMIRQISNCIKYQKTEATKNKHVIKQDLEFGGKEYG